MHVTRLAKRDNRGKKEHKHLFFSLPPAEELFTRIETLTQAPNKSYTLYKYNVNKNRKIEKSCDIALIPPLSLG